MEDISYKVNEAQRKVTKSNMVYAKLNIEHLKKYIKQAKSENPQKSVESIINELEKSYKEIALNNVSRVVRNGKIDIVPSVTRSDFCLLRTLIFIKNNPHLILETIDKSDKRKLIQRKDSFRYTTDRKNNLNQLLQDVCSIMMGQPGNFGLKQKFISDKLDYNERTMLQKEILNMINVFYTKMSQNIRISYIKNITDIAKILDNTGCFEKGIERHNRKLRMLRLNDLQEENSTKKSNKPTIKNMSDWKQSKAVEKLSLDELIVASAFFTNRICKEYITLKKSIFLFNELGIEEDRLLNDEIDENSLKSALIKYEFLQKEARTDYINLKSQIESTLTENPNRVENFEYDLEYSDKECLDYKNIFGPLLPNNENNLFEDRKEFSKNDDAMEILYQKKDFAIDSLIMSLLERNSNQNWGYITEEKNNRNSIQNGKAMVILGFDINGFNMPIRLHTLLSKLQKLVEEYTGSDMLPVYNGENDWFVESEFDETLDMNTQIFRPTNKYEKKILKEKSIKMKEDEPGFDYVSHLNWIANGIVPKKYIQKYMVSLQDGSYIEREEKEFI